MKLLLIAVAFLAVTGFILRDDLNNMFTPTQTDKKQKKGKKDKGDKQQQKSDVSVKQKWNLPEELLEVSGIASMDRDRVACVQDEQGTIYIFNKSSGNVEKKIPFAGTGDFEGITLKGNMAYIVRADGTLYEVDMNTNKTNEYRTSLTSANDIEALCYDARQNQLLLAGKGTDAAHPGFKAIYSFDLVSKRMDTQPGFKISLSDKRLNSGGKNGADIMPSAMATHPSTGDIYIVDGTKSLLITLDRSSNIKAVYALGKEFAQPEGITFGPGGELLISNEGKKQPGNILQVSL